MVQVIQGYPSRSSAIGQILGESLGEGLGNFMGMYQANKSLEKVLSDPSMKDAPIEQRLTALQKALSPHGKRGQSLLKQRLEMEEVIGKEKERATEAAQKLQAQTVAASDQQLLAKEASGIKLTQEELAKLSPKSLTDVMKARNKSPAGGLTGQPVPQDVQSKMSNIIAKNKGADADTLQLAMDSEGVPPVYSKPYVDSRRVTSEYLTKGEIDRSSKFLDEVYKESESIPVEQADLNRIKAATHIVSGLDQDYLADLFNFEPLRTQSGAVLKSAGKDLFIKSIQGTGARPNQWIEQQIGSALTQLGKSEAANQSIAEMYQFRLDVKNEKIRIAKELEEKYMRELGYVPSKIARETQEILAPFAQKREDKLAYDLRVLYEKEQGNENLGFLKKVPPGTPLTPRMASVLLKKTNNDEKAAINLAKSMGFELELPEGSY